MTITQQIPSGSPQGAQAATQITIFPSRQEIRPFSDSEHDYTAQQFFDSCEAIMDLSKSDSEKIRFIKSYLEIGSSASLAIESRDFAQDIARNDYSSFKKHFLQEFDRYSKTNFVKAVSQLSTDLLQHKFSLPTREAMREGTIFGLKLVSLAKDHGWMINGQMSDAMLENFLNFIGYIMTLNDDERRAALTLEFHPDTTYIDFNNAIRSKLETSNVDGSSSKALSTRVAPVRSVDNAGLTSKHLSCHDGSSTTLPSNQQTVVTCTYCYKPGHSIKRCFKRRKQRRLISNTTHTQTNHKTLSSPPSPSATQPGSTNKSLNLNINNHSIRRGRWSNQSSSSYQKQQQQQPQASHKQHNLDSTMTVFCQVHRTNTHSTDDCHAVQQLANTVRSRSSNSGECVLASHHIPP